MTTIIAENFMLNNISIESRDSDNFINATQLCKAGGREFNKWFRLDETKELIRALEDALAKEIEKSCMDKSIDHSSNEIENSMRFQNEDMYLLEVDSTISENITKKSILIDIKKGGGKNALGSWIHPDLAVPLAQWISPAFGIQVSRWIRELLLTGSVNCCSKPSKT
jgi:hypothetical protein